MILGVEGVEFLPEGNAVRLSAHAKAPTPPFTINYAYLLIHLVYSIVGTQNLKFLSSQLQFITAKFLTMVFKSRCPSFEDYLLN